MTGVLAAAVNDEHTYINIILNDGTRILSSENIDQQYLQDNSLDRIKDSVKPDDYLKIENGIKEGESGVFQFTAYDREFYTYYAPVGLNFNDDDIVSSWRFLIMIPYNIAMGGFLSATEQINFS